MRKLILFLVLTPIILSGQSNGDQIWQMNNFEMIFDEQGVKVYPRKNGFGNFLRTTGSICDSNGEILFYSNGCQVGNRHHQLMPNGDSLNYNFYYDEWLNHCEFGYLQRQDLYVLPDPGKKDGYYIIHKESDFTIDSIAGEFNFTYDKLNYSYVDMSLDNGLGAVTEKNITFFEAKMRSSHLTIIRHSNGQDWWIMNPALEGNTYYRCLLTATGVTEIDSLQIGPEFINESIINTDGVGESRFSPDGTKYAYFSLIDGLHLYDYDRATGILSNLKLLPWTPSTSTIIGGLEFSPNSRFIYLLNQEAIVQVDTELSDLSNGVVTIIEMEPVSWNKSNPCQIS